MILFHTPIITTNLVSIIVRACPLRWSYGPTRDCVELVWRHVRRVIRIRIANRPNRPHARLRWPPSQQTVVCSCCVGRGDPWASDPFVTFSSIRLHAQPAQRSVLGRYVIYKYRILCMSVFWNLFFDSRCNRRRHWLDHALFYRYNSSSAGLSSANPITMLQYEYRQQYIYMVSYNRPVLQRLTSDRGTWGVIALVYECSVYTNCCVLCCVKPGVFQKRRVSHLQSTRDTALSCSGMSGVKSSVMVLFVVQY